MLKIIYPVSWIPNNSKVTKVTGSKEYILVEEIKVYDAETKPIIIKNTGTRFLISPNDPSSINCVSDTTELIWIVEEDVFLSTIKGDL